MLDRLPPSLQLHVLLEWLSPKTVCAVARAGSSQLRRAILTAPSAFRAAKDEIVSDACIRWFQLRRPPPCPPLAFSTTVTVAANGMFVHHQSNGKTHRDEDDLPAVTWANSDYLCGGVAARLGGGVSVPDRLAKDPSIGRYFQMERIFAGLGWFWTDEEEDGAEPFFTGNNNNNNNNLSPQKDWWRHGQRHRDGDLPAVVRADGTQIWFKDGVVTRDADLPAFICANGARIWFKRGKVHREDDSPAVVHSDGGQEWFVQGLPFRRHDRPTSVQADGTQSWLNLQSLLHRDNDRPAVLYADGRQEWYQDGELHRDGDQPAIVLHNGSSFWYRRGRMHRDNGQPAMIQSDGTQKWFQHGKLHRDGDKPAVVWVDGQKEWYQRGQLHRDGDQPANIFADRLQQWYQRGQLHRDGDLPAIVRSDGSQEWFQDDMRHRGGGEPAFIGPYGRRKEWWEHGRRLSASEVRKRQWWRWAATTVSSAVVSAMMPASLLRLFIILAQKDTAAADNAKKKKKENVVVSNRVVVPEDSLYDLIIDGTTVMSSRRLRHEMAMLLDFLHIGFKFTTTGHTGDYGMHVGHRTPGGRRGWDMLYMFQCVQKKKFVKENLSEVYLSWYSKHCTVREAEMIVDRLFQPDIGLDEFCDLSWAMNMDWPVPCDSHQQIRAITTVGQSCGYDKTFHPYEYVRVHAITRTLDLVDATTPQVLLDLLRLFVVNKDTLAKKALQRLRQATDA